MKRHLKESYGEIATSLKKEWGKEFEREEIIRTMLEMLEKIIED